MAALIQQRSSDYRAEPGGDMAIDKQTIASRTTNAESRLQAVEKILRQTVDLRDRERALGELRNLVQAMATDGIHRDAPMREICARVGDRWSSLILLLLSASNFRHSTLRRLIGTVSYEGRISQRMLTLRLRGLERDGLIARHVTDTHPPGTEYSLTELGRGLLTQFENLMRWIRANNAEIYRAREQFSARSETPRD